MVKTPLDIVFIECTILFENGFSSKHEDTQFRLRQPKFDSQSLPIVVLLSEPLRLKASPPQIVQSRAVSEYPEVCDVLTHGSDSPISHRSKEQIDKVITNYYTKACRKQGAKQIELPSHN